MTRIQVKSNVAYVLDKDIYTKGQVGATIRFEFSNDWSNYVKVVVFVAGEYYKNVIVTESGDLATVAVPWEVLGVAGVPLRVGVYGSNSLGTKLVPTIWCDLGIVRDSADPTVDMEASPTFVQQIMVMVDQAKQYRDESYMNMTEIENMTVDGTQLPAGSQPTVTKTIQNNVVNLSFGIPKGDTGTSITNITAAASPDDEGYNTIYIYMSNGTQYTATVRNGSKGDPGNDGISITGVDMISGDHAPGTFDTYRITFSDDSTFDFQVYNGKDSDLITVNGQLPDANGNIEITAADIGAATAGSVPTKVSELENDAGYLTEHQSLADYAKKDELGSVAFTNNYNSLDNKPVLPVHILDLQNNLGTISFKNKTYDGSSNITIGVSNIDHAVPDWRTINGKSLESNVVLQASDVGADPSGAATSAVSDHNASSTAHESLFNRKADLVNGKIPGEQIPPINAYLEYPRWEDFPGQGDSHIFYVAQNTSRLYRWNGSQYVETSYTLSLGTGHNNAFYGDWGYAAYEHSQITDGSNPHNTTAESMNLATVATTGDYNDLINKPTNFPQPSVTLPLMDGNEAIRGTSLAYAREDHVHPRNIDTVMGYLYNGQFYETKVGSSYDDLIQPDGTKLFIDKNTNQSYRYDTDNVKYVIVSIRLGTTHDTAGYGDESKAAYDHSLLTSGNPHNVLLADLGVTATAADINALTGSNISAEDIQKLHAITATANEINQLHESGVTKSDLTKLNNITATSTEINQLSGSTVVKADLDKLHDVTADATELNKLDGAEVTTAELNYLHGVTSDVQTQIDGKVSMSVSGHVLNLNYK